MYMIQYSRVRKEVMFISLEEFQKEFIMEVTLVSNLNQGLKGKHSSLTLECSNYVFRALYAVHYG